jgi:hypothetical protein
MKEKAAKRSTARALAVLGLGVILGGVPGASTCEVAHAQNPYSGWGKRRVTRAKAVTPPRGGAVRKQIADAMRRDVGQFAGVYVVFNFDWIKTSGNWAYAQTRPESPDGANKYEPIEALLRRSNGVWSVVGRISDGATSPASQRRRLRARFPSAPRSIFPG